MEFWKTLQSRYASFKTEAMLLTALRGWIGDGDHTLHTNFFGGEKVYRRSTPGSNIRERVFVALHNESFEHFSLRTRLTDHAWTPVYESVDFSLFQQRGSDEPITQSLSTEDERAAFGIVRKAIQTFLANGETMRRVDYGKALPPVFGRAHATTVDVTLWVGGALRGSKISKKPTLFEAFVDAAIEAAHDERFKPLDIAEVDDMRIEVYIFSDFYRPLTFEEAAENGIDSMKGYGVYGEGKRGWYLPSVWNAVRFTDAEDFLRRLAHQKAGISHASLSSARFYNFEIHNRIEGEDHSSPLVLKGGVALPDGRANTPEELKRKCNDAAAWLMTRIDTEGYVPTILDPLTGKTSNSWPRVPLGALSLAEYGTAVNDTAMSAEAARIHIYMKRRYNLVSSFQPEHLITRVYLYQLGSYLRDNEILGDIEDTLLRDVKELEGFGGTYMNEILFLQLANIFLFDPLIRSDAKAHGRRLVDVVLSEFETLTNNDVPLSLAKYAELIPITFRLGKEDERYRDAYAYITSWYTNQQCENGCFPNLSHQSELSAYTRGTGKMFEALAIDERNSEASVAALTWLLGLQYTADSVYFVPSHLQPKVVGGLRHDYRNYELWTDSVSHMLLGASRLFSHASSRIA